MHSEVYAYFELPQLRDLSFDHEIWVDRFLISRWKCFYESSPEACQERLRRQRKLVSTNPNPFDFIEQQIAGYFHQNIQWAEIWRAIVPKLTVQMYAYANRKITSQEHGDWLISQFDSEEYPIPFFEQAQQFAEQYRKNKEIFGNQKLIGRVPEAV
jgi:hypothetical protein